MGQAYSGPGPSRMPINVRKKYGTDRRTDRQTDKRHTETLRFSLDAASIISSRPKHTKSYWSSTQSESTRRKLLSTRILSSSN